MRIISIIIAFVACLSCSKSDNIVVLDVNGTKLTKHELSEIITASAEGYDNELIKTGENAKALKRWVVNQIINEQILVEEANKRDLFVSPTELNEELNSLSVNGKMQNKNSDAYKIWIKRASRRILARKSSDALISEYVKISDKDIKKYYNQNRTQFKRPYQCRFRQIINSDKKKVSEARGRWEKGEDFQKLVSIYSSGAYKERGGDTGFIDRDLLPSFLGKSCDGLKIGEVSLVMESPYGFSIVMLVDRRTAHELSFAEAKPSIENILKQENGQEVLNKWLAGKRKTAVVVINWENIDEISL